MSAPSKCQVCGVSAQHSYYGAIVCRPCKTFFRRNGENRQTVSTCDFGGNCEIDLNTRHVCTSCRLAKCFQVGMTPELFRTEATKKSRSNANTSSALVSVSQTTIHRPQRLRVVNLLDQDQSLLTKDQWTHISNLTHAYDRYDALPAVISLAKQINSLHPRLRFKTDSMEMMDLSAILLQAGDSFVRANQDFTVFPVHERAVVMRYAMEFVSCFLGGYLACRSNLIFNSAFRSLLQQMYGPLPYQFTMVFVALIDEDVQLAKLTVALCAFYTNGCTLSDVSMPPVSLQNTRALLNLQHMYGELIWKYLLYKYKFEGAVRRFSRLIQCICAAVSVDLHLRTIKSHMDAVEPLIERIEGQYMNSVEE